MDFIQIAKDAKDASLKIADISTELKNKALQQIADEIELYKDEIFSANKEDLQNAQSLVDAGEITKSTFNRLKLDENKMRDMVQGIRVLQNLKTLSIKNYLYANLTAI